MNYELEYTRCNLCGVDDTKILYAKYGSITHLKFNIVSCRNCGLVYVNPRLTYKGIMGLYNETYYRGEGFDRSSTYLIDSEDGKKSHRTTGDSQRYLKFVQKLKPFTPGQRLLDIGCGLGNLVEDATKLGYDAEGVEISEFAFDYVKSLGLRVHYGDITQINLPENGYDVITAMEVIEHTHNPMEFLKRVFQLLRVDGLFYYTTSSFDHMVYRRLRMTKKKAFEWVYIMPEGHIYYFTQDTMIQSLRRAGFRKLLGYTYGIYDKTRPVVRLIGKLGLINLQKDRPATPFKKWIFCKALKTLDCARNFRIARQMPVAMKVGSPTEEFVITETW